VWELIYVRLLRSAIKLAKNLDGGGQGLDFRCPMLLASAELGELPKAGLEKPGAKSWL
jgi:hypothetical protein